MDLGGDWLAAAVERRPAAGLRRRRISTTPTGRPVERSRPLAVRIRRSPTRDGPILYRRRFDAPVAADGRRRWFLTFDGIFYQGDVWLDGEYLGDTEGYFFPHTFEVTDALSARTRARAGGRGGVPPPGRPGGPSAT